MPKYALKYLKRFLIEINKIQKKSLVHAIRFSLLFRFVIKVLFLQVENF